MCQNVLLTCTKWSKLGNAGTVGTENKDKFKGNTVNTNKKEQSPKFRERACLARASESVRNGRQSRQQRTNNKQRHKKESVLYLVCFRLISDSLMYNIWAVWDAKTSSIISVEIFSLTGQLNPLEIICEDVVSDSCHWSLWVYAISMVTLNLTLSLYIHWL